MDSDTDYFTPQIGKRHEGLQKLVDVLPAVRHKVSSMIDHLNHAGDFVNKVSERTFQAGVLSLSF